MNLLRTDIGRFRVVSLLEGLSYVWLFAVAMPLKYIAGNTSVVPLAGRIHGGLFVAFCIALYAVATDREWPWKKSAVAMLAAIIPLGAFWLEHELRKEQAAQTRS